MFSPSSHKNNTDESKSPPNDIPDPCDWIQEHHSLACVAETLNLLNQTPNHTIQAGEDFSYTSEGELIIGLKTRELLKAHCGDRHWQYVRNYLPIQKG